MFLKVLRVSSCIKPHLQWVCSIKKQERISYIKPTAAKLLLFQSPHACVDVILQVSHVFTNIVRPRFTLNPTTFSTFQLPNKLLDILFDPLPFGQKKRKKDMLKIFSLTHSEVLHLKQASSRSSLGWWVWFFKTLFDHCCWLHFEATKAHST